MKGKTGFRQMVEVVVIRKGGKKDVRPEGKTEGKASGKLQSGVNQGRESDRSTGGKE